METIIDKEVSDRMAGLVEQFNDAYKELYDMQAKGEQPFGYYAALCLGEQLIYEHSPLVDEFNKVRGYLLMSDREVAAFGCAVAELGLV